MFPILALLYDEKAPAQHGGSWFAPNGFLDRMVADKIQLT
jgi:hypothetical protein